MRLQFQTKYKYKCAITGLNQNPLVYQLLEPIFDYWDATLQNLTSL
jgi:hypothetical protein